MDTPNLQSKRCPVCSGDMIDGLLKVRAAEMYGTLYWQSKEKHSYLKEKLLYIRESHKKVHRRIELPLVSSASVYSQEKQAENYSAWYCPECGRIDISCKVEKIQRI